MDRAAIVVAICAAVAAATLLWRRRKARPPARVDARELGLSGGRGTGIVEFASPYCLACEAWEGSLREAGLGFAKVDVAERPELARRYGVQATPLVLAVDLPGGRVIESYAGDPSEERLERLASLARPSSP